MAERSVGAYEAKTHLAALLDDVERGESVIITRNGRAVARITPIVTEQATAAFDRWTELRKSVKPLGMMMKDAINWGRKHE